MTSIRWPLVSLVAAIFALATALWSAPAAELVTAEVDGSVPIDVTVERGATAPFTIYVSATGSISCTVTAANPSTAKVHTSYSVSSTGSVTSSAFSSALNFYASGSGGGNCPITWTDPSPATPGLQEQTVSASVTVGSSTPLGNYSIALSAGSGRVAVTNPNSSGGKLDDNSPTSLIFHVIAPTPPADITAPVIVPHVTPSGNADGWNNTDVLVTWSVTDPESTVTSSSGCGPSTLSSETAGQTLTCTATSAGGTSNQSVTVRIDKTAPVVSGSRAPGANANGWNNTDVTVSFNCADTGSVQSGISTNTVAGAAVSGEGSAQSVTNSGACIDKAGNAASAATVGAINIDKTAPVISGSRTPEANANGWNNTDVSVSFTCVEAGLVQSDIATDTVAGATVSGEGAGQSVTNSGDCIDNAGNAASPSTVSGINIDKTAPQISGSPSPEANTSGWNNTDVTVSFDCADTGVVTSGIATDTLAGGTLTGEGTGQSVTNSGACVDNAGNAASPATVGGINIDKTSPVVSGSRTPDANANGWNNTDVSVSFTCVEAGAVQSGIASDTVAGGTVSGEGSGQSLTSSGDCIDKAGNAASPATVGAINIDKTSPVISGSRDPMANASGWNNTDVAVSFNCADAGSVQSSILTNTVAGATVSGEGSAQSVTNSGDCIDNAGNAASPATVGGVNIDKTVPQISGSRDPEANANGWNNTDVAVSFTCADAGSVQSGIATVTVAGATLSGEGAGQSVTSSGDCIDNAGNAATSATIGDINIDKTAPQISGNRSPDANAHGWNNTDVTVSFTCSDAGAVQSGIASDTVAAGTVSSEGSGQSLTNDGDCIDNAGNAASPATVGGINIDKTAPVVGGSRDPEANANGWNNTDVAVSFTCSDTGAVQAGIASDTVAGDTVTSEGAGQSVTNSGDCIDNGGNAASPATVGGINIDKTSPVVSGSRDPEANANGWNNSDVAVSFTCAEAGAVQSGIATDTVAGDTVAGEGAGQSVTNSGDCVDNAGNAASPATVAGINIDKTAPQISSSRDPEANANGWNNTDVAVSFTCADTGALQAGIASDTVAGDTITSEGAGQSVTNRGDCIDNGGNAASPATVSGINIDKTSPVVSGSRDPEANANGWNNSDVAVSFTCADSGPVQSGIASDTVAGDTLSGEGAGQSVTNSGACLDNAGNAAPAATLGDVNIDKTGPLVSGSRSPEPNANGWNNADVTVSFACADSGPVQSGIASDTVAGDTLSGEGAGQSVTNSGACLDNAGNAAPAATLGDVNIDKTGPLVSGSRSPEPNANGWNNADVTVSFACADSGLVQSGIASDTVAGDTLSGEGASQSVTNSGACVDNAGNVAASATVGGINIDKTAPQVSGGRSPEPNANGWNNADVTVSFACADSGLVQSGIASDTVAGNTVTSEGAGQSVTNSGTCVDNAGNVAPTSTVAGINIDKTAPQVSGSRSPGANVNGWNNTNVTVKYDCTDSLSLVGFVTHDQVVSAEGAGQSRSGTCIDNAGNSASASVLNINIDKTSPIVAVTGFSDGDVFHTGQSVPAAGCATPEDSLSGVASSNGPSLIAGGLNANGVGYVGYGCSATDRAGNAATSTAGFSVSYGGVSGILQPINPNNSSLFKRGQAVPVKFRLAGDEPSGFATGGWTLKRVQVSCSTLADLTVVEDVSSVTPSSTFRYDPSADQYIYNADFRSVDPGTCWRVRVTLDDGTVLYSAYFKINR